MSFGLLAGVMLPRMWTHALMSQPHRLNLSAAPSPAYRIVFIYILISVEGRCVSLWTAYIKVWWTVIPY